MSTPDRKRSYSVRMNFVYQFLKAIKRECGSQGFHQDSQLRHRHVWLPANWRQSSKFSESSLSGCFCTSVWLFLYVSLAVFVRQSGCFFCVGTIVFVRRSSCFVSTMCISIFAILWTIIDERTSLSFSVLSAGVAAWRSLGDRVQSGWRSWLVEGTSPNAGRIQKNRIFSQKIRQGVTRRFVVLVRLAEYFSSLVVFPPPTPLRFPPSFFSSFPFL